MAGTIYSLPV